MYSFDTKRVYVLEINTTPCLTDENSTILDTYADKFLNLLGIEERNEEEDEDDY